MKKNSRYRQGIFVPKNIDKFIGERAIYRSGLELKFFRFCDNNPKVVRWGSENVVIPYYNPLTKRNHRYHVDNYVVIKEGTAITKYLVEIKPYKQTLKPTTKYKQKKHIMELDENVCGFNVGINIGETAGQTVFHAHVHLIPRRKGDVN